MSTHNQKGASYDAATIAYEAAICRLFNEEPKWRFAPYAYTLSDDGSRIFFDYDNRPIVRIKPDGQGEIIPPDAFVYFALLADLHADDDGCYDPAARKTVMSLIEKHNLAQELRRRWGLFQRGELPEPTWGGRT